MNVPKVMSSAICLFWLNVPLAISGQISVINPAAGGGLAMAPSVPSAPTASSPAASSSRPSQSALFDGFSNDTSSLLQRLASIDTSKFTAEQKRDVVDSLSVMLNNESLPTAVHVFVQKELEKLKLSSPFVPRH